MTKWYIEDNILKFMTDDGISVIPSSDSIVRIVREGATEIGEIPGVFVHKPDIDLPELRFSFRYPRLAGAVHYLSDSIIKMEFSVTIRNARVDLSRDFLDLSEHMVFNGTWYSLHDAKNIISSVLEDTGITDSWDITLDSYLKLRKSVARYSFRLSWTDDADPENLIKNLNRDSIETPERFTGNLYPYQKDGYYWMKHFTGSGCGCILGDEMGLGKTIQVIALIVSRRETADSPALVVCPVSLLENWRREIEKFSTGMKVYTYHGDDIPTDIKPLKYYDIVLTTYGIVSRYYPTLNLINWDLMVLDEAQYIKNPDAQRTRGVKRINRKCGIAVSGTPFENRLTDIWSITDFVYPGYLGSLENFKGIDWVQSKDIAVDIEPVIRPILLRRKVSEVADDLPERINIPVYLEMDERGAEMYEEVRLREIENNPGCYTLPMLLHLRMFCSHPMVYPGINGDIIKLSRKYQALVDIVDEIVANGEKFIIFTCYNKMNSLLVSDLSQRFRIPMFHITGEDSPSTRQGIIDDFSSFPGAAGIVLNPKAAGTGLNITAANNVIHYEPVWNPAVEDQATARAYRRGQTLPVRVYRFIYSRTVEEVLDDRLEYKREVSGILLVGNKGETDSSDVERALEISPFGHPLTGDKI